MHEITSNTNAAQRAILAVLGFVRVDGLPIAGTDRTVVTVRSHSDLGTLTSNNGTDCLATDGGEIWVRRGYPRVLDREDPDFKVLLAQIAPNEGIGYVYFSNSEVTDPYNLINRFGDPDWMPRKL